MVPALVLLTFVAFLVVDALIESAEARRARARLQRLGDVPGSTGGLSVPIPVLELGAIAVPQGVFLDSGHTWVGLEPAGLVKVGLDAFARRVIGKIERVNLPKVGQEVRRGQRLFSVLQGNRLAPFLAPVDGVVSSVNEGLAATSDALHSDPYGSGWICTLSPRNLARNLRRLLVAEESKEWLGVEIQKLRSFLGARLASKLSLGAISQDGGQMVEGVLEKMDSETWDRFVSEFLQNTR